MGKLKEEPRRILEMKISNIKFRYRGGEFVEASMKLSLR